MIDSFLFNCLLLNQSFQTNPNKITNCFQLFSLLHLYNYIAPASLFDFWTGHNTSIPNAAVRLHTNDVITIGAKRSIQMRFITQYASKYWIEFDKFIRGDRPKPDRKWLKSLGCNVRSIIEKMKKAKERYANGSTVVIVIVIFISWFLF